MTTTGSDGKQYEMLCIPLNRLQGWLFTVNPNKVRADIKDKVVKYQDECFQVLHDYWTKGAAINQAAVDAGSTDVLNLLKQAVAEIEAKNLEIKLIKSANEQLALENNDLADRNEVLEKIDGSFYIHEAAKVLGAKQKLFRDWLKENKILNKDGSVSEKYREKGWLVQAIEIIPTGKAVTVAKLTTKGFSNIEAVWASEQRPMLRI